MKLIKVAVSNRARPVYLNADHVRVITPSGPSTPGRTTVELSDGATMELLVSSDELLRLLGVDKPEGEE